MCRLARRSTSLLMLVAASLAATDHVRAEQPAATSHLPAALLDLGLTENEVLSNVVAATVRGHGLVIADQGVAIQFSGVGFIDRAAIAIQGSGGGDQVSLAASPAGFAFQTRGTAVSGGFAQEQGVLVTQTGVFNGAVGFSGSFSSLEIIALPGFFSVDFR